MRIIRALVNWALPEAEGSAARRFLVSGAVWFALGAVAGLLSAVALMAPDAIAGVSWLEFGRLRPVHVGLVVLGFTATALVGALLYLIPVLLRNRLYAERVANLAVWLWDAAFAGATVTLLLGYTQGREYAEWIFPVKALFTLALLLLVYVLVMTVVTREEKLLYVTVWYGVGAVLWTALVYPLGNVMWRPETGSMGGIVDAIWLWWYGHNIFGLVITPMAVGVAYYVIPRVSGKPLYSHTLSLIGFWTLLALYAHIGGHHILQAPIPTWLKTVSVIDSVAMIIPVSTALVNLWMTMRGAVGNFANHLPGRMIFTGTVMYLITCVQGPLQSLPSVQRYTHFNNWVIGHAHIAVLGFGGLIALGGLWYVLPLVAKRQVWSERLVALQYWLVLIGVLGFLGVLTIAGLVQGQGWVNGDPVYKLLPSLIPYMVSRAMFGVLIFAGAWIGLYNVLMTIWYGKAEVREG